MDIVSCREACPGEKCFTNMYFSFSKSEIVTFLKSIINYVCNRKAISVVETISITSFIQETCVWYTSLNTLVKMTFVSFDPCGVFYQLLGWWGVTSNMDLHLGLNLGLRGSPWSYLDFRAYVLVLSLSPSLIIIKSFVCSFFKNKPCSWFHNVVQIAITKKRKRYACVKHHSCTYHSCFLAWLYCTDDA